MMLGVPEPTFAFGDELPEPVLPVTDGEPLPLVLLEPTVPVVCGTPALPTPVPKFGVTVVLPGPGPPGTPPPDVLPGCRPVAPPGAVLPTLPLEVPVPLVAPPAPPAPPPPAPPPPWASASVEPETIMVARTGVKMRIGTSSKDRWVNDSREAPFRSGYAHV